MPQLCQYVPFPSVERRGILATGMDAQFLKTAGEGVLNSQLSFKLIQRWHPNHFGDKALMIFRFFLPSTHSESQLHSEVNVGPTTIYYL